ncbi:MAG: AraC family transcriptional regulator [Victivallales bacterium]|nr:AraC family transcriptional regulator [Victivallales bacterium]
MRSAEIISRETYGSVIRRHSLPTLHLSLLDFQRVCVKRSAAWRPHIHREFELVIPCGCTYRCLLERTHVNCASGDFLLIQPGQLHQDHFVAGDSHFFLHFNLSDGTDNKPVRQLFSSSTSPQSQVATIPDAVLAEGLQKQLFQAGQHKHSLTICEGMATSLFLLLPETFPAAQLLVTPGKTDTEHSMYQQVLQLFEIGVQEGFFPRRAIEKRLGVGARTWTRLCHTLFDAPPKLAFERFRLDCANRYMMEHTEASVKEVAARFHYPDPFYFSRVYTANVSVARPPDGTANPPVHNNDKNLPINSALDAGGKRLRHHPAKRRRELRTGRWHRGGHFRHPPSGWQASHNPHEQQLLPAHQPGGHQRQRLSGCCAGTSDRGELRSIPVYKSSHARTAYPQAILHRQLRPSPNTVFSE